MGEVGNPTILATFAVIAAVLPMAFVGGLMGPYMRPIPLGSSAAMFWSLLIAFIVTPWASIRILKWGRSCVRENVANSTSLADDGRGLTTAATAHPEDFFTRLYRRMMNPLIRHAKWRWAFLAGIVWLELSSSGDTPLGYDRKDEPQRSH